MKLFTLVASALGLAHAAEEVADAAHAWQSASTADKNTWKTDVLHAEGTAKQIKNKSCQLPKGKTLRKLGAPKQVSKHYYKLQNGNTRATYQFKFSDGTMVYAGNANVGQKGGDWKVYCYRQGTTSVVTKGTHDQSDLSSAMVKRLRSVFKAIDKDGSGTITTGGAYTGLSQVFPSYSLPNYESTLEKESIRAAGKDKVVDLDEFECVAKKLMNIKQVYDEFKQYDQNHDLKMDRKELENALIKFYFKDVAKPGLIQTAAARANVKKTVDAIMKRHDKNKDSKVEWSEFEMDAFMEEHYQLGAKCETSKTPLNKHEVSVVDNLIKKFHGNTKTKEMSHSMWYQITSMVTEQAIDMINGAAKGPPLGCMRKKPSDGGPKRPTDGGPQRSGDGRGQFGSNGGKHFGYTATPVKGQPLRAGPRVLLARMMQDKAGPPPSGKPSKPSSGSAKAKMTVMQVLQALHKQADTNNDGKISDHEILDIFQGIREKLSASDFGTFLDLVNKLHGPVNCGKSTDCGKCTAVGNAGLCGWFAESQKQNSNPFGGAVTKSKGTCKFVDRSMGSGRNADDDSYKINTCGSQCKNKPTKNKKPGNNKKPVQTRKRPGQK